jgi:hypothetical protein
MINGKQANIDSWGRRGVASRVGLRVHGTDLHYKCLAAEMMEFDMV